MTFDVDTPPLPLWRDWAAWLFVLLVLLSMAIVLQSSNRNSSLYRPGMVSQKIAPPADVIPAVLPMELAPVDVDDARAANQAIPLVTSGFASAAPFFYPGDADNRARARDCMAAALLYEAGDDSRGQRAVGQVIINRVRHPAFPKSLCGVVFQGSDRRTGCQFTFTCDGALNRRYSDGAWLRAQSLADLMLSGFTDSTVGLATHYHTDWVRPYWSDSLEKIAIVDTHLFFRWPGFWGTPRAFRRTVSGSDSAIGKLAALSIAHSAAGAAPPADLLGVDIDAAAGTARVATAKGESGGRETITILLDRRAPPESFVTLALRLCGTREYCKFMGWTNPVLKPEGEAMSDTARGAMSFSYLRDDKAGFEKALWNCSEYKRDDARQCMKR